MVCVVVYHGGVEVAGSIEEAGERLARKHLDGGQLSRQVSQRTYRLISTNGVSEACSPDSRARNRRNEET
jgi:hypothetical protein